MGLTHGNAAVSRLLHIWPCCSAECLRAVQKDAALEVLPGDMRRAGEAFVGEHGPCTRSHVKHSQILATCLTDMLCETHASWAVSTTKALPQVDFACRASIPVHQIQPTEHALCSGRAAVRGCRSARQSWHCHTVGGQRSAGVRRQGHCPQVRCMPCR